MNTSPTERPASLSSVDSILSLANWFQATIVDPPETPEEKRRDTFADFINQHNPGKPHPLLSYEHVPRQVAVAQKIIDTYRTDADGRPLWTWAGPGTPNYRRVLVMLPQQYFKTELWARLLAAYFLKCFPDKWCGLASYGSRLAWKWSGNARDYYKAAGGFVRRDTDAKNEWHTTGGGGMWADGVEGTALGRPYHLGLCDDLMKVRHHRSHAFRDAFESFWAGTWINRQQPGAAIVVDGQRLGFGDPFDFLFRREVGDDCEEAPEHWHVVCCDEIKSNEPLGTYDGPMGLPPTCTLEEDPREIGEPLARSRFTLEEVRALQKAAGVYCDAHRQQRATHAHGDFWDEAWFGTYGTETGDPIDDLPPGCLNRGRDWDTAYTAKEANSATAQLQSCRHPETIEILQLGEHGQGMAWKVPRHVYITDLDWRWVEAPARLRWMRSLPGPHHVEAKASGKSDVQLLQAQGLPVSEVQVTGGDKYSRAGAVMPYVDTPQPRVLVHASLIVKFLHGDRQGLMNVTKTQLLDGSGDLDLNDVFVQAIARHVARAYSFERIA